jgi:hypothetical protein
MDREKAANNSTKRTGTAGSLVHGVGGRHCSGGHGMIVPEKQSKGVNALISRSKEANREWGQSTNMQAGATLRLAADLLISGLQPSKQHWWEADGGRVLAHISVTQHQPDQRGPDPDI